MQEQGATVTATPSTGQPHSSYGRILKASSITGGSKVVTYAVGLIKTKAIAVILGPFGVGIIGMYASIVSLGATISGMGLNSSGVRDVAAALGRNDDAAVAAVTLAVKRLGILLGIAGAVALALLAPLLADLVFSDRSVAPVIALLGLVLFIRGLNRIQTVLIQGHRRIGALAKVSILSTTISATLAVVAYYFFGMVAIVPVMIATAVITVMVASFYTRGLQSCLGNDSWAESWPFMRHLLVLGIPIAYGGVLGDIIPFFARGLVIRELGAIENGYYMAAWSISGLFAQFVIAAMSADFFPRISAVADDQNAMDRLVNEQIEVGALIAAPGIVLAMLFAPLAIIMLYSSEFSVSAMLLPWFLLGVLGRIINWPMGLIVLAKGHGSVFAIMQTISVPIHLVLILLGFHYFGLIGVAMAFALHNILYSPALLIFLGWRYGYRWSEGLKQMLLYILVFLFFGAVLQALDLSLVLHSSIASFLFFAVLFVCATELFRRLGDVPIVRKLKQRLPGFLLKRLS